MPRVSKCEVVAIVLDLKMDRKTSIGILEKIFLHKQIALPKNSLYLFLLNARQPNNRNIASVSGGVLTLDNLNSIVDEHEIDDCNWLDGLEDAVETEPTQLILISELNDPPSSKNLEKQATAINCSLKKSSTYVYVTGPKTHSPDVTIWTKEDVNENMKNFEFTNKASEENGTILKTMLTGVNSVICGLDLCLDYLCFYRPSFSKQPSALRLKVGSFEFPTTTVRIVKSMEYPRAKYIQRPVYKWKIKSDDVQTGETEYDSSDLVKVYSFMDKVITLPEDVENSFKYQGEAFFKVVGFVDSDRLPEMYLGGEEIFSIRVKPEEPRASAFHHFIKSTYDKKKYAIALRAYNRNNAPRQFILIPKPPYDFIMVPHPFVNFKLTQEKPVHNPATCDQKKLQIYSDFVNDLSKRQIQLHPSASVGVFHKQYLENLSGLVLKREPSVVAVNDAIRVESIVKVEEILEQEVISDVVCKKEEVKVEECDVDEDDW